MSAMESSTKNPKEMLEKLTLSYNRHGSSLIMCLLSSAVSVATGMVHARCCRQPCDLELHASSGTGLGLRIQM